MDNSKLPSFGKSDKQIADAFGMSVSDFKKVKKQIVSDMTKPKAPTRAVGSMRKLSDVVKPKATAKPTAKPTPKATTKPAPKKTAPKVGMKPTPLSKSEKDFLAGQKLKAKITKRTGVYPNTAN